MNDLEAVARELHRVFLGESPDLLVESVESRLLRVAAFAVERGFRAEEKTEFSVGTRVAVTNGDLAGRTGTVAQIDHRDGAQFRVEMDDKQHNGPRPCVWAWLRRRDLVPAELLQASGGSSQEPASSLHEPSPASERQDCSALPPGSERVESEHEVERLRERRPTMAENCARCGGVGLDVVRPCPEGRADCVTAHYTDEPCPACAKPGGAS